MKTPLILGKGYFGKKIAEVYKTTALNYTIYDYSDVAELLKKHKPETIINCIGFTGSPNVDDCENHIDKTLTSNTFVPILLAEACIRRKIKLVHISSGCIYSTRGFWPILEDAAPDFFDLFYSRTKIYSEAALLNLTRQHNILIVRPRIPLDTIPHPKNILTKLLKFKRVINCPNSVTYMPDFTKAVQHLIKIDAKGLFNVVNAGEMFYSELLDVYRQHNPAFLYQFMDYKELPTPRTNLLLSTSKLCATGFNVRQIRSVLHECVERYLHG